MSSADRTAYFRFVSAFRFTCTKRWNKTIVWNKPVLFRFKEPFNLKKYSCHLRTNYWHHYSCLQYILDNTHMISFRIVDEMLS